MPIYTYEVILDGDEAEEGGAVFEVMQGIHDPPLTKHPNTGQPVRRIIVSAPTIGIQGPCGSANTLSDQNLSAKGFSKYKKVDNGVYEKVAGLGPDKLHS